MEKLFVLFGSEILKIVPGRVSTEVDARYTNNHVYKIIKIKKNNPSVYSFNSDYIVIIKFKLKP